MYFKEYLIFEEVLLPSGYFGYLLVSRCLVTKNNYKGV